MKVAVSRTTALRRPTPLRRRLNQTKSQLPKQGNTETKSDPSESIGGTKSLQDGLAICLFGLTANMYISEDEEEVRKRVIMSEVLPDEVMYVATPNPRLQRAKVAANWSKCNDTDPRWAAWAKNEAPLRQGRGWYPALDRHFLELLVISEIHCLSHPLHSVSPPGTSERIHRHASRVRRVACDRIGAERLHAYCERVKEAFEAYMHGAWGGVRYNGVGGHGELAGMGMGDMSEVGEMTEEDEEGNATIKRDEAEGRGRSMIKGPGSVRRDGGLDLESGRQGHKSAENDLSLDEHETDGADEQTHEIEGRMEDDTVGDEGDHQMDLAGDNPFADPVKNTGVEGLELGTGVEGDLLRIDLDDVQEIDEEASNRSSASSERMDIDISLDPAAPTAGETPQNDKSALHSTSALAMSSPSVRPGDKVAETSGPSLQAGTTTGLGVVA